MLRWIVVILAVAAVGTWLVVNDNRAASTPSARLRIAVLPFTNLTGDAASDYIADGLTDELIAQLGRISPKQLGVIARTSVMRYRETQKSVTDVGRELGVSFIVEGSVRRDADRLRVTSQLVDVRDQAQIWADTFERAAGASMDLQTDVATRVARALSLELVPATAPPSRTRATRDAAAWDAYLLGRYWLNRGTPSEIIKALERFEVAAQHDPQFPAVWAEIAEARHAMVMTRTMAPLAAYPPAIQAAKRALALDSALPEAHRVQGSLHLWHDWQPEKALASFERALELNPSDAIAHHDYAWSLVALGRMEEAVAQITTARDLDPLSVRANTDIGWLHLHIRKPVDAMRACQHTLAIQPDSIEAQPCLERAYVQQNRFDEALAAARASLPPASDIGRALLEQKLNAADHLRAIWRWRVSRMEEAAQRGEVSRYSMAVHRLLTGDSDNAVHDLEAAFERREPMVSLLRIDPAMDPLREDVRFQRLLERISQSRR